MSDLAVEIEKQVQLAEEYGFKEVFIRMPLEAARKAVHAFKDNQGTLGTILQNKEQDG